MVLLAAACGGGTASVAISADVTSGPAPLRVTFSNLSGGTGQFFWDFGDGATQTSFDASLPTLHEFKLAGVHVVTLKAGGPGPDAETARLKITVEPGPPGRIDFGLGSAVLTVAAGESVAIKTVVRDRFGNEIPGADVTITTRSGDGGMGEDGLYVAPSKAGTYPAELLAEHTSGGVTASGVLAVVVVSGPLSGLVLIPDVRGLAAGRAVRFLVLGVDRFGNELPDAETEVGVGPGGVGIVEPDLRGRLHMPTASGEYPAALAATATLGNQAVSRDFDISVAVGRFDRLVISPPEIEVEAAGSVRLSARAVDEFGNDIPGAVISYSADPTAGSVGPSGDFTAVERTGVFEGAVTVEGEVEGRVRRASVTVTVGAGPLDGVVVNTAESGAGAVAGTRAHRLSATAIDRFGNPLSEGVDDLRFTFDLPRDAGVLTGNVLAASNEAALFPGGLTVTVTQPQPGVGLGRITRDATVDFRILPGPLDSVALSPARSVVPPGERRAFTAVGLDRHGNPIAELAYEYAADPLAGEIDAFGVFRAGEVAGAYERGVSVLVREGGATATTTAAVTVAVGILKTASIEPAVVTTALLSELTFSAVGLDGFGNRIPGATVTFSADPTVGVIGADGRLSIGTRSGNFADAVTATVTSGGRSVTATAAVIVEPGFFIAAAVLPEALILGTGQSRRFEASALDAFGNPIPEGATVAWRLADAGAGTIDGSGLFTASTPGNYPGGIEADVTIDGVTFTGSANLTVLGHRIDDLVISGAEGVEVGSPSQLTVTDQTGSPLPQGFEVVFTALDPAVGTVSASGVLTAGLAAGTYGRGLAATATRGGEVLIGFAPVRLTAGPLDRVAVTPGSLELGKNQAQRFVAVPVDRYGNPTANVELTWSVDRGGGAIAVDGWFTAGAARGVFRGTVLVTAKQRPGDEEFVAVARASVDVLADRVAFRSHRFSGLDAYVLDAERRITIRLTEGGARTVRWSPDGRRILYDQGGQLYVVSDDGRWRAQLFAPQVAGDLEGSEADWSPDGKFVVFERGGDLYVAQIDGTSITRLTDDDFSNDMPVWSPDGNFIAFASDRAGSWDIWRMETDGGAPTRLTTNDAPGDLGSDTRPAWSPDSNRLAFVSGRGGNGPAIYQFGFAGQGVTQGVTRVTPESFDSSAPGCPAWAGSNQRLVFHAGTPSPELFLIDLGGATPFALTPGDFTDICPDWSPPKRGLEAQTDPGFAIIAGAVVPPPLPTGGVLWTATSSVVMIEVRGRAETTTATAFVVDETGKALTTNSAVAGASSITALAPDGRLLQAVVVGRDLVRDLAVISISDWDGPALELGNVGRLAETSTLYVVGHAEGRPVVVTVQRLDLDADPSRNIVWLVTDGDWQGRFEGAPVIGPRGKVVGIITHRIEDLREGLTGLALSANTINSYLDRLLSGEVLSR